MKRITLALVLGAAALTPHVSLTHAASSRIPAACGGAVAPTGLAIVQAAKKYLGVAYRPSGHSPKRGFDPLGFVSFVYACAGIHVPHSYKGGLHAAPHVNMGDLQPGDMVYFSNTIWLGLSHAGIYIGNGQFIHAEWYNVGVTITSFTADPHDYSYWQGHYATANRPLPAV